VKVFGVNLPLWGTNRHISSVQRGEAAVEAKPQEEVGQQKRVLEKKNSGNSLTETDSASSDTSSSKHNSGKFQEESGLVRVFNRIFHRERLLESNVGFQRCQDYMSERSPELAAAHRENIGRLISGGRIHSRDIESFEEQHWVLLAYPRFVKILEEGKISAAELQKLGAGQCSILRRNADLLTDEELCALLRFDEFTVLAPEQSTRLQELLGFASLEQTGISRQAVLCEPGVIGKLLKLTNTQCGLLDNFAELQDRVAEGEISIGILSTLTDAQCALLNQYGAVLCKSKEGLNMADISSLQDWQCMLLITGNKKLVKQLAEIISLRTASEVKELVEKYDRGHVLITYINAMVKTNESPELLFQLAADPSFIEIGDHPVVEQLLNDLTIAQVLPLLKSGEEELTSEGAAALSRVLDSLKAVADKVNREYFFRDFLTQHPLETLLDKTEEDIEALGLQLSDSQQQVKVEDSIVELPSQVRFFRVPAPVVAVVQSETVAIQP